MGPVVRGMVSYDKLTDGTITLWYIALMNDAIAAEQENQQRAADRQQEQRRG